jgi:integrase/recombinase XerD
MTIRTQVEDYLAMRRSLGYALHGEGRMLLAFADRLDPAGQNTVTVSAALAWAIEPHGVTSAHWSRRLGIVRIFARHLHTLDPSCEISPADLLPGTSHRPTPVCLLR